MAGIGSTVPLDHLAPKVISMVEQEKFSNQIIARRLDLSKNTVHHIERLLPNSASRRGSQPNVPITVRPVLVHTFIILVELTLLTIQYFRMEVLAFDVLPDLADLNLGFMYGSHLLGLTWLLVVILISYVTWELVIRVHSHGYDVSRETWVFLIAMCIMNGMAMIFEFILFRMLVKDFANIGVAGAAELFGLLMVAVHQLASFWIMKNVVHV